MFAKKKPPKRFYVVYVDDSTQKVREFRRKKDVKKFVREFRRQMRIPGNGMENGFWIDYVFDGRLHYTDSKVVKG